MQGFAISAVIGAAAGLSTADDAGRHYLIGVAAAVQFAIFPVWLGAATVVGLPSGPVIVSRMGRLLINLVTIAGAAVIAYALTGIRREELRRMSHVRFSKPPGSRLQPRGSNRSSRAWAPGAGLGKVQVPLGEYACAAIGIQ